MAYRVSDQHEKHSLCRGQKFQLSWLSNDFVVSRVNYIKIFFPQGSMLIIGPAMVAIFIPIF